MTYARLDKFSKGGENIAKGGECLPVPPPPKCTPVKWSLYKAATCLKQPASLSIAVTV